MRPSDTLWSQTSSLDQPPQFPLGRKPVESKSFLRNSIMSAPSRRGRPSQVPGAGGRGGMGTEPPRGSDARNRGGHHRPPGDVPGLSRLSPVSARRTRPPVQRRLFSSHRKNSPRRAMLQAGAKKEFPPGGAPPPEPGSWAPAGRRPVLLERKRPRTREDRPGIGSREGAQAGMGSDLGLTGPSLPKAPSL
jgi:hypothetical protein